MTCLLLVLLLSLSLALSGCGSEKEEMGTDTQPLTVQAGPDQTARPGETVVLSGTAGHPGGTTLSYLWRQTGGPLVALSGADTPSATFTAPDVSVDQTLTFRLTVASDRGTSASDQAAVTILAEIPEPGRASRLPVIGLPTVEQPGDVTRTLGDPTRKLHLFEIDYDAANYVCTTAEPDPDGNAYFNVYERDTYDPPDGVFVIGGTISAEPAGVVALEISCGYQTTTPIAPGTATVTVALSNAAGAASRTSFNVTVQDLSRDTVDAYGHTCTDELDTALDYSSLPRLWDGTPFTVNVSAAFPDAAAIMDQVRIESDKIEHALGYRILAPGRIVDMPEGPEHVWNIALGSSSYDVPCCIPDDILHPVPEDRVDIRCCIIDDREDDLLFDTGFARLGLRTIVLAGDIGESRICPVGRPCLRPAVHSVPHELWHLLGFGHPGESGVPMSQALAWLTDRPSTEDMARLACIYD